MSDKAKRTLTPKLRFPEFREDWKAVAVGDFFDLTNKAERAAAFDIDKILTVKLHTNGVVKNEKTTLTGGANYFRRRAGQFIFSKIDLLNGAFGIVPRTLDGFSSSTDVPAFSFNGKHSSSFFLSWFKANYARLEVERSGTSSTLKRVSPERLLALEVPVPPPAEQQKIADCLASLDEVIDAQGRKVEALKAHKKGLMQRLFPREGETLPRLRFPEFRDAGEWEERKAGTLFSNRIKKGEDGLPIYSVTIHDGMVRRDSFDRDFYDIEDATGNKKACKNDIAYNMMRMWQGACGVAPEDCLVSPAYVILSPLKGVVSAFFEYLLKLPPSLLLLTSHSRGLTKDRLRLYYDDFTKIPLRVPSLAEQQRIADCLSSLDVRLAAEAKKLAALKTHKKGLMQRLFPSPEGC